MTNNETFAFLPFTNFHFILIKLLPSAEVFQVGDDEKGKHMAVSDLTEAPSGGSTRIVL